jgi:multidrug efflux pump subunit AcrA (membrane-fusion protein)
MLKWFVIILAVVGLALGVWTVFTQDRANPEPPPASPPSINPFPAGIAATGIVESASRDVAIGAPEAGLVRSVSVQVGDRVAVGDVLFRLDARVLKAQLSEAQANLKVARAELAKAEAAPRPVSVPPLEAAAQQAESELSLARIEFRQTRQAYENDAATQQELDRARARFDAAEAGLAQAKANLSELKAGTWSKDLAIARENVDQAQARIRSLKQQIERLTVRAPLAGTVLKRRVEPGEYVNPASNGDPALTVGRINTLHVRAQVDEEDAAKLRQGAAGIARIRGSAAIEVPLTMLRIEPLAEPKRQLTGVATELVDTRVIEVVFEVTDQKQAPLYPGMLVDVFIEGPQAATQPGTQAATQPIKPSAGQR